ncbi:MAG: amino acid adenylation domain-containing protein [Spirochaetes bacterium]|nr:amino acid adenylation domain-containing protein [Spirochaetota bacterium]
MVSDASFLANPHPEIPGDGLLHQLFESSVKSYPDNTAVISDGATITYAALERSANRFAHYLRGLGIGYGDRVCVLIPRSIGLYASLIGILKTGASYVPLDTSYPADRIAFIAHDSGAKYIVTTETFAEHVKHREIRPVFIDRANDAINACSAEPHPLALTPHAEAYVIYTSGTTGRPKGVMIRHTNAYHLINAEQSIYRISASDKVLQGFSPAFDASVEEIWTCFQAGATLVAGTPDIMQSGPQMPEVLSSLGVTVLSCVPSFLSMFDGDIPTVRLLILGGEACIPHLLKPWFTMGRRIFNTYGPTETTVVATLSRLHPDVPVTIGTPLPNYTAYIMDEHGTILDRGRDGELVIGGAGVANGYLNRDELTHEKFIMNRLASVTGDESLLLYRTGDRARIGINGEIEYLGRIDTQVKIRGYRIELGEIEAELVAVPGIAEAAVVAQGEGESRFLAAFVTLRKGTAFDDQKTLTLLRKKLPPYMVPAFIEILDRLPKLASGKVNRNGFPERTPPAAASSQDVDLGTPVKNTIFRAWCDILKLPTMTEHDDFFTALGGHSLLAAQFVSRMRKDGRWPGLSMRDLYENPTIASMAKLLERTMEKNTASSASARPADSFRPVPGWRYIASGFIQVFIVIINFAFYSLQWVTPFLVYSYLRAYEYGHIESLAAAVTALALVYPTMLVTGIALKWIVLGRVREGEHPVWGLYYLRWLFVRGMLSNIPLHFLSGTPLIGFYLKLLGVRVGKDVYIDSDLIAGFDTLAIGDNSSLNSEANISCHSIEDGLLKIGRVTIGNNVSVGIRAIIAAGSSIGDNAVIEDLTCIATGMTVGAYERWRGSPARKDHTPVQPVHHHRPRNALTEAFALFFYSASFFILPVLGLLPIFPGVMFMYNIDYATENYFYLLSAPFVGIIFVSLSMLQIIAVKWIVVGRMKTGVYPLKSFFRMRKWLFDKFMEISLGMLGSLYATLYLLPWYRALGVKLGSRAEVSTASFILPDLLSINDRSFIADGVGLGAAKVENGMMTLKKTAIGARTFIGNSAFIPIGTSVGSDCLIGCLTLPPESTVKDGTSWVGTPAVFLPKRERRDAFFAEETTYAPPPPLIAKRLAIEFFRVILPSTAYVLFTTLLLSFFIIIEDEIPLMHTILLFPLIYTALGIGAAFMTAIMKRIIVGKYKPGEHPLWSTFVWKTELMTGFIENFTNPFFANHLMGTVFLPWYFRLMGMKIGKRACIHTMDFTEFDLVTLEHDVALNEDCTIQTHLFEDRIMKLGAIHIGSRVSVGSATLVLYDTEIEDDVKVGDLSLVMKGETLCRNSSWTGSPVSRVTPQKR